MFSDNSYHPRDESEAFEVTSIRCDISIQKKSQLRFNNFETPRVGHMTMFAVERCIYLLPPKIQVIIRNYMQTQ